jgi:hypothetical protein
MESFSAAAVMMLLILGVILLVCWIVLPFALIGTKPLLRQIIANQHETHRLLRQRSLEAQNK